MLTFQSRKQLYNYKCPFYFLCQEKKIMKHITWTRVTSCVKNWKIMKHHTWTSPTFEVQYEVKLIEVLHYLPIPNTKSRTCTSEVFHYLPILHTWSRTSSRKEFHYLNFLHTRSRTSSRSFIDRIWDNVTRS